jgi:hypothetical protein
MSTTTSSENFEEMIENAIKRERKRAVGLVLSAYGVCKLSGQEAACRVLDALATKIENEDGWGGEDR